MSKKSSTFAPAFNRESVILEKTVYLTAFEKKHISDTALRKGGWVAETNSLLNCRTGNCTGGSNPPSSAKDTRCLVSFLLEGCLTPGREFLSRQRPRTIIAYLGRSLERLLPWQFSNPPSSAKDTRTWCLFCWRDVSPPVGNSKKNELKLAYMQFF